MLPYLKCHKDLSLLRKGSDTLWKLVSLRDVRLPVCQHISFQEPHHFFHQGFEFSKKKKSDLFVAIFAMIVEPESRE